MDLSKSDRSHKILDLLGKDGGWCGIQKITAQSQIPKSLVVETIQQLVTAHQVQKQSDVNTKKNWYRIAEISHTSPSTIHILLEPNTQITSEPPTDTQTEAIIPPLSIPTVEIEEYLTLLEEKYGQFGTRSQILAAVTQCVKKLTSKSHRSLYIRTLVLLHYLSFNSTQPLPKLISILHDFEITTTQFVHQKTRLLERGVISPTLKVESSIDTQESYPVIQKSLPIKIKMDILELQKKRVSIIGDELQLSPSYIDLAVGILPRLSKWNTRTPNLIAGVAICLICQMQQLHHKLFRIAEIANISQSSLYLLLKEVKESLSGLKVLQSEYVEDSLI